MLQLQERLDDAMWAKEEEWGHGLEEPVTGKTKQRVRLTPPKLRLIPFHLSIKRNSGLNPGGSS